MQRITGPIALVLSAVAVLAIVLVGWFVLISPQRSKADDLEAQISAAQAELASDQATLATPNKRKTAQLLLKAERALPTTPQVSQILRQLSLFSAQSRTELDSITPGAPIASAGAESMPISLTFKGRYFALQKLMRLLRTSADAHGSTITGNGRLYSVDSIGFSGAQGATTGGLIAATVALNAYIFSTPPAPVTTPTDTTSSSS